MIKIFATEVEAQQEARRHFAGIVDVNGSHVPFGGQPRQGAAVYRGVWPASRARAELGVAVEGEGFIVVRRINRNTTMGFQDFYAVLNEDGWVAVS